MVLEERIGALLLERGWTLATAESCTGGLLGHRITNVPGSSAYYAGGLVAYSYEAKEALLGVRHETLLAHGAVSEQTAVEMAQGARRRLETRLAVALTGIAGPGGGMPEKPVGLVYIALSAPDAEVCRRYVWEGDRLGNKEQSAEAALRLLLAYLGGEVPARAPATARGGGPQLVDKPVTVETRPGRGGKVRPVAFVWRSRRYAVESWGRERAVTVEGRSRRCYLVQTAGAETWELCQEIETAQWHLMRHWAARAQAV